MRKVFVALFFFTLSVWGVASAAEPSFRHCDGGYVHRDFGGTVEFGQTSPLDGAHQSTVDNSDGFSVDCEVGFEIAPRMTFFAFGGYERYDIKVDAASFFTSGCELFAPPLTLCTAVVTSREQNFSLNADHFRIGAGTAFDVIPSVALYGKAGVSKMSIDTPAQSDVVFIQDIHDGAKIFGEAGLRWSSTRGVEVGVFGLYDGAGEIDQLVVATLFEPAGGALLNGTVLAVDGDWRVGAEITLNIFGPVGLNGRYELGEADRAFIGARVSF